MCKLFKGSTEECYNVFFFIIIISKMIIQNVYSDLSEVVDFLSH